MYPNPIHGVVVVVSYPGRQKVQIGKKRLPRVGIPLFSQMQNLPFKPLPPALKLF